MNYQIIADEEELDKFLEWLPDTTEDECYYICLFARSKYVVNKEINHINSDKAQLKRFTSVKSRIKDKLRQLECPIDSYKQRDNDVPEHCLAVYIHPNPRSNIKAARKALMRVAELIAHDSHGYNLHQEIISEVQKAKSRTEWIDFDFDVEDKAVLAAIKYSVDCIVNKEAYRILETRGGYHFLISPHLVKFELKPKWYQSMSIILNEFSSDKDNKGDNMIPIPGTNQGGFIPRFI